MTQEQKTNIDLDVLSACQKLDEERAETILYIRHSQTDEKIAVISGGNVGVMSDAIAGAMAIDKNIKDAVIRAVAIILIKDGTEQQFSQEVKTITPEIQLILK